MEPPQDPNSTGKDESAPDDGDIIELTDLAADPADEDEDIIDLVDVVPQPSDDADDDQLIELSEALVEEVADREDQDTGAGDWPRDGEQDGDPGRGDQFDETAVEGEPESDPLFEMGLELAPDETDSETQRADADTDLAAGMGIALGEKEPDSGEPVQDDIAAGKQLELAAPSDEQIDDALTRVIEKLYGEKIEALLYELVDKKVSDEIDKIKALLFDDPPGGPG